MADARILVVEDEAIVARNIKHRLERLGYTVPSIARTGQEALDQAEDTQPDLVLMDVRLQGEIDGIEAADKIRSRLDVPVVYLTGYADETTLQQAKITEPFGYILKPFEARELRGTIEMALHKHAVDSQVRESEAWFRAVFETARDPIFIKDRSLRYTRVNPAMEELFGIPAKELVSRRDGDLFGDGAELSAEEADASVLGGQIIEQEHTAQIRGETRTFHVVRVPMQDRTGEITGLCGIARDISERKSTEETLRRRNRELALLNQVGLAFNSTLDHDQVLITVLEKARSLLKVVACSIWLTNPETMQVVCRQAAGPGSVVVRGWRLAMGEGIVGWVAQHGESVILPDLEADERHFREVDERTGVLLRSVLSVPLRVRESVIGVIQVMDTDPGRFSAADLPFVESLASAAAIAIDNAQLYREADRLRAYNENIVQSMEEGILLEDASGVIAFANPKASELLDYSPQELIGRHWKEIVAPDYVPQVEDEAAKRPRGIASRYEAALLTKDEDRLPVIISARPLFEDERFAGVLSVFTDITERVQAEQEREALIADLREALARVKMLSGLLPICSSCKKIRDERGRWHYLEEYIHDHSEADFSHGLCPDCARQLYPEFFQEEE
jgi:PAS domain S-box-containing protein